MKRNLKPFDNMINEKKFEISFIADINLNPIYSNILYVINQQKL